MKNHSMFRRFIVATTSASLVFASVAPATAALAAPSVDLNNAIGIAQGLMQGEVSQDELISMLNVILADQGISLSQPDVSGIINVLDFEGDMTGVTIDFQELLADLGISMSGVGDFELDLTQFYAIAGVKLDDVQEASALIGGLLSGNPDAIMGFLEGTGLADITMGA